MSKLLTSWSNLLLAVLLAVCSALSVQAAEGTDPHGAESPLANQKPSGSIGISFNVMSDGTIVVVGMVPGGPAAEGGLRTNDVIISVDGHSLPKGAKNSDAAALLKGAAGEKMTVVFRRGDYVYTKTVVRGEPLAVFLKAADAGDEMAMRIVGDIYRDGRGVARDEVRAAEWYKKGAEAGDATAMVNYGSCAETGSGTKRDAASALEWYKKAALIGHPDAMRHLAAMYKGGLGIDADPAAATEWAARADHAEQIIADNVKKAAVPLTADDVGEDRFLLPLASGTNKQMQFVTGSEYLRGVKRVAVEVDIKDFPGLDQEAVEKRFRERLAELGIKVVTGRIGPDTPLLSLKISGVQWHSGVESNTIFYSGLAYQKVLPFRADEPDRVILVSLEHYTYNGICPPRDVNLMPKAFDSGLFQKLTDAYKKAN